MRPGAEPFSAAGSGALARTGVLVLHGFTGSPVSVRGWAEHLAAAGLAVRLPRLPGHGTRWQEMAATRWQDWYDEAARGLAALTQDCDTVVVAGLSMGGTLALRLAELSPELVSGAVTVNASLLTRDPRLRLLPVLQHVVPSLPGIGNDTALPGVDEGAYDRVPLKALASLLALQRLTLADLGRIVCPVLAGRSRVDHVVTPDSGRLLTERTASGLVTEQVLERSHHVATMDHDAPEVFAATLRFVRERAAARAA